VSVMLPLSDGRFQMPSSGCAAAGRSVVRQPSSSDAAKSSIEEFEVTLPEMDYPLEPRSAPSPVLRRHSRPASVLSTWALFA
jgi:hypothetical protein